MPLCQPLAQLGTVIVQTTLTTYALASSGTVRPGTVGFRFNAAGSAAYVTQAGDSCTLTAIAGEQLITGLVATVGTLPAGTLALVSR